MQRAILHRRLLGSAQARGLRSLSTVPPAPGASKPAAAKPDAKAEAKASKVTPSNTVFGAPRGSRAAVSAKHDAAQRAADNIDLNWANLSPQESGKVLQEALETLRRSKGQVLRNQPIGTLAESLAVLQTSSLDFTLRRNLAEFMLAAIRQRISSLSRNEATVLLGPALSTVLQSGYQFAFAELTTKLRPALVKYVAANPDLMTFQTALTMLRFSDPSFGHLLERPGILEAVLKSKPTWTGVDRDFLTVALANVGFLSASANVGKLQHILFLRVIETLPDSKPGAEASLHYLRAVHTALVHDHRFPSGDRFMTILQSRKADAPALVYDSTLFQRDLANILFAFAHAPDLLVSATPTAEETSFVNSVVEDLIGSAIKRKASPRHLAQDLATTMKLKQRTGLPSDNVVTNMINGILDSVYESADSSASVLAIDAVGNAIKHFAHLPSSIRIRAPAVVEKALLPAAGVTGAEKKYKFEMSDVIRKFAPILSDDASRAVSEAIANAAATNASGLTGIRNSDYTSALALFAWGASRFENIRSLSSFDDAKRAFLSTVQRQCESALNDPRGDVRANLYALSRALPLIDEQGASEVAKVIIQGPNASKLKLPVQLSLADLANLKETPDLDAAVEQFASEASSKDKFFFLKQLWIDDAAIEETEFDDAAETSKALGAASVVTSSLVSAKKEMPSISFGRVLELCVDGKFLGPLETFMGEVLDRIRQGQRVQLNPRVLIKSLPHLSETQMTLLATAIETNDSFRSSFGPSALTAFAVACGEKFPSARAAALKAAAAKAETSSGEWSDLARIALPPPQLSISSEEQAAIKKLLRALFSFARNELTRQKRSPLDVGDAAGTLLRLRHAKALQLLDDAVLSSQNEQELVRALSNVLSASADRLQIPKASSSLNVLVSLGVAGTEPAVEVLKRRVWQGRETASPGSKMELARALEDPADRARIVDEVIAGPGFASRDDLFKATRAILRTDGEIPRTEELADLIAKSAVELMSSLDVPVVLSVLKTISLLDARKNLLNPETRKPSSPAVISFLDATSNDIASGRIELPLARVSKMLTYLGQLQFTTRPDVYSALLKSLIASKETQSMPVRTVMSIAQFLLRPEITSMAMASPSLADDVKNACELVRKRAGKSGALAGAEFTVEEMRTLGKLMDTYLDPSAKGAAGWFA